MSTKHPYVSRGGLKLAWALDTFGLDPKGWICADLGASTGGFTDCLLMRGVQRVWAVDRAWGQFAWKLRTDPRVMVLERTDALRMNPPVKSLDLVTLDLGWTVQARAIPAALRWGPKLIVSLIKPQYESPPESKRRGVHDPAQAQDVVEQVLDRMASLGVQILAHTPSPILGGASRKRQGNQETLALLRPLASEAKIV